ncbi:MAG: SOS response-associated peptidase [Gemmatimonadetes bacterium]|nr:SOS response-associated peptidase [Gemmatimonadota bacterium]
MCGRFTLLHHPQQIAERFSVDKVAVEFPPRYNIAPTQPVAVIFQHGERYLEAFRWGLIPFWSKDAKIGSRMINARAETVADKPAYRAPFKHRRCLIPSSGFYEWKKEGKEKTPTYIRLADERPFAMAGLWEEWTSPEDEIIHTCTIITTQANDFMSTIHHRMPVIFTPEQEEAWLDSTLENPAEITPLLQPYAGEMAAHPVSKQVNIAAYDGPDCIEPAVISP